MSILVLSVYQNAFFFFMCVCVCVCVLCLFLVFVARLSKIANNHSLLVLFAPYLFFFFSFDFISSTRCALKKKKGNSAFSSF